MSTSFAAHNNAATYGGGRPVFCDVDPATGNATAETVHAALTLDTRVVIVVDQVWFFHSDKVITTGEGGMLATHRADWAAAGAGSRR